MFVNPIGGLLQELDENGLALGTYIRDEDHDSKYSQYDPYWDYDPENQRWFRSEYIGNKWVESTKNIGAGTSKRANQYSTAESPIMVTDSPSQESPDKLS
jgi:hypothetical protein